MEKLPRFAVMAKVGAPHGVKGDLKLHYYSEAGLAAFSAMWIQYPSSVKAWEPIPSHHIFSRGQRDLIHFEGWNDRDEVRKFTHSLIAVNAEELPLIDTHHQDHEFYWSSLENLSVINLQGIHLGRVDHLFATGANDVLVVKKENQERLLPFIDSVIRSVDQNAKIMTVDWDEDF